MWWINKNHNYTNSNERTSKRTNEILRERERKTVVGYTLHSHTHGQWTNKMGIFKRFLPTFRRCVSCVSCVRDGVCIIPYCCELRPETVCARTHTTFLFHFFVFLNFYSFNKSTLSRGRARASCIFIFKIPFSFIISLFSLILSLIKFVLVLFYIIPLGNALTRSLALASHAAYFICLLLFVQR